MQRAHTHDTTRIAQNGRLSGSFKDEWFTKLGWRSFAIRPRRFDKPRLRLLGRHAEGHHQRNASSHEIFNWGQAGIAGVRRARLHLKRGYMRKMT